ncbi:MAG: DUF115 domain-containing protein [Candidatus Rifleibacteriota bacterium]
MNTSVYEKNLGLLKRFSALYNLVLNEQKRFNEEVYRLERAKTGVPALIINQADAKPLSYHSKYDPVKEASRQVDASYEGQTHILLLGFGLGYMAEEIVKRLEKNLNSPQIFVVEPDPLVFISALRARDLTHLLSDVRLVWCVGMTPDQIGDYWNSTLDWTLLDKLAIVDHPPSMSRFRKIFDRVVEKIRYLCNRSKGNLVTLMHAGFAFHSNNFANLANSFLLPGIDRLFGKFQGVPAIIVAAGPSLDKNMHLLKNIKGKFPIIAVDTAFRQLVANGIKPDIVCAADPSYENSLDFVGVEEEVNVILALEPMTHPDIFASFKGAKMVMTFGGGLYPIAKDFREPVGKLICWGSIATTVYDLALKIGADPVVFIGLDLSFQDGRLHARGSYSDDLLYEKVNPYTSVEHETTDYIATRGSYKIVKPDGTVIYTDQNMKLYKDWFEDQFRQTDRKIINATEGGAVDKYVELSTLAEVIDKYSDKSTDVAGILNEAISRPVKADIRGLVDKLTTIKRKLQKNETALRKSVSTLRKLMSNYANISASRLTGMAKAEFHDVLKLHDELCGDPELFPWVSIHQAKFMTRHIMEINNLKAAADTTVGMWLAEINEYFTALDKFHEYQMPLLDGAIKDLNDKAGNTNKSPGGEYFPNE